MQIKLLFFANYRDLAGAGELMLELPAAANVCMLVDAVRERGGLSRLPDRPTVAVNREYASPDHVLSEGDEVAFLPPVAGG